MTATGLTDLVAQAYESACNPDGLASFIHDTANYFGARQSAVAIWSVTNSNPFLPITHGMPGKDLHTMFDQRGQSGTLFGKLSKLSRGETFASRARQPATPAGELQHETDAMHSLAGLVVNDGDKRCAIVLFREAEAGEFKPVEQESLQTLIHYYQRAIELNQPFIRLVVEHKAALAVLDSAPRGVFFLGQSGQVTYQNSEARMFFAKKDGLHLRNGLVQFDDREVSRKLDDFIVKARSTDDPDSPASLVCRIPRHSKAAPFQLIVSEFPFNTRQPTRNDDEALAMAIIYDPVDVVDLKTEMLQSFYNLSKAEARLARALYRRHSLADAAAALDISVHTARSELKNIFRKVGVKSQSALLVEFAKAIKMT